MFGQTEMNYIVGNSHALWPAKPGSMGRPYPGHRIAVIDDDGNERAAGRDRARSRSHRVAPDGTPDPVFFLEYFKNPEGTRSKVHAATGAAPATSRRADADGYLWYQGRADDMFKAAGYRIGPSEIENCLVRHAGGRQRRGRAVARRDARQRRQGVHRAGAGHAPSPALEDEIQQHVRSILAPLRVSEGDRVHRRAADDDDRQGAAQACCVKREASAKSVAAEAGA